MWKIIFFLVVFTLHKLLRPIYAMAYGIEKQEKEKAKQKADELDKMAQQKIQNILKTKEQKDQR